MTATPDHQEFPFAAGLGSTDRERLLVQLMASVWETILQLPILAREGLDEDDPRDRARPGPGDVDPYGGAGWLGNWPAWWGEEGSRVLNDVVFACLGHRVRVTFLQPTR